MEKFVGTFQDGFRTAVWATDIEMARFHLRDWQRLHGALVEVAPLRQAA